MTLSEKKLKQLLYPDGRQKDIYRKISYPIVKLILPLNIHPDVIHVFRLLFLIAGTILFCTGNWTLVLIGALCFQLNILFDTFDGALARHQGKASVKGEYQDVALDHLASSMLYFASVAGFGYALTKDARFLWIGLATVLLAQVAAFLRAMYTEYSIPASAIQNGTFLVRLAHQDNSRVIALVLLLTALFSQPAIAAGLFLLLVVAKILILSVHVWSQSGRNPLSLPIFIRYLVLVVIIKLWLLQHILGINTSRAREKLSRSKHRSVIEKQITARLA